MKRFIIICLIPVIFAACEDVYVPDLDDIENVIVVDARIVTGETNYVSLTESNNFNEQQVNYESIEGATVLLIDNNNTEYSLNGVNGNYFLNFDLDSTLSYKLSIEYKGDIIESTYETVPKAPELDTVYGVEEVEITRNGGSNSVDDFIEEEGLRLYANIKKKEGEGYYRFTASKIAQYTYTKIIYIMGFPVEVTMYGWNTYVPNESFNIAGPPEYGNIEDINKHPLYFMEKNGFAPPFLDRLFAGWIIILEQYNISKSAYDFYKDLNNQLDANGKLFDPLYVQARNNLKCITDPAKIVLGNFEISRKSEKRYFVRYIIYKGIYEVRPIYNFYDIPKEGYDYQEPPYFWE